MKNSSSNFVISRQILHVLKKAAPILKKLDEDMRKLNSDTKSLKEDISLVRKIIDGAFERKGDSKNGDGGEEKAKKTG